ncbi:hypothetical protein WJ68_05105 [Burkholderia ubonensis]|uniref:Uncharacterized protein n=1 Tax=Burkholderia ubonensis TaxID=101571 RepID=A0ABD4E6X9_9BURK|nr:hypothetical protein WJ68_05105 [Burkholderia ubonensis]
MRKEGEIMEQAWDFATLAALYDRGHLVPFIGSGMSIGECVGWSDFVDGIERHAGIKGPIRHFVGEAYHEG